MSNYKPFFKYLGDLNLKLAGTFVIIVMINMIIGVAGTAYGVEPQREVIYFSSQSDIFSGVVCILVGFFYSLIFFSSAMSIRADRVGYLKAAIYWGIIFTVGFGVFAFIFDNVCRLSLETLTGVPVEFYSITSWNKVEPINAYVNISKSILTNMTLFTTGFAVGAIWYRLKVRTSVLIFAVLPVVVVTYCMNYSFKNPDKANAFLDWALGNISDLMSSHLISSAIKVLIIIVSSIVAIRLLIKAPIKDYANDLI